MKLVLFKGGVETQEYFSFELARKFQKMGYEIFFYDLLDTWKSIAALEEFVEPGNTVMFTFNFNGIGGEDGLYQAEEEDFVINAKTSASSKPEGRKGSYRCFWDTYDIPCFNMVVDHPYYYHHFIEKTPKRYYQISIDRAHETYMKRFFPKTGLAGFVPLGGTRLITGEPLMPLADRPMDIVFTGNYSRPETFDKYIEHLGEDYVEFYHSITEELITKPWMKLEELAEQRLKEELGNISDEDLKPCLRNMISIDLSVRFHFRAQAVRNLIDNGFKVNVYGSGWETLECRHPENLIKWGGVNSEKCLEVMNLSKVSLNVMPWFKEGAHDRIFNAMLNGALCLTDSSSYLFEEFTDGKELLYFELPQIDRISHITGEILSNPQRMAEIADNGRIKAEQRHTWAHRAEIIDTMIKKLM